MKLQKEVRNEVIHIAIGVTVLCVLLNVGFLVFGQWDFTVLWGSLFGSVWAVLNFVLLGITVQKAAACTDPARAKNIVQFSYSVRMLVSGLVLIAGVALPCFHWLAVVATALFQRITIFIMQIIKKVGKGNEPHGTDT